MCIHQWIEIVLDATENTKWVCKVCYKTHDEELAEKHKKKLL